MQQAKTFWKESDNQIRAETPLCACQPLPQKPRESKKTIPFGKELGRSSLLDLNNKTADKSNVQLLFNHIFCITTMYQYVYSHIVNKEPGNAKPKSTAYQQMDSLMHSLISGVFIFYFIQHR